MRWPNAAPIVTTMKDLQTIYVPVLDYPCQSVRSNQSPPEFSMGISEIINGTLPFPTPVPNQYAPPETVAYLIAVPIISRDGHVFNIARQDIQFRGNILHSGRFTSPLPRP